MFLQQEKGFSSSSLSLHRVFDGARRAEIAHVCIDPQRDFVRIKEGFDAVARIGAELVPAFRAMGISNYWVYMVLSGPRGKFLPASGGERLSPDASHGGFCNGIVPKRKVEKLFSKTHMSAFVDCGLAGALKDEGKKVLLISGFEFPFCVFETARQAQQGGYKTILLQDGTDYHPSSSVKKESLEAAGIVFANSEDVLSVLRELKP